MSTSHIPIIQLYTKVEGPGINFSPVAPLSMTQSEIIASFSRFLPFSRLLYISSIIYGYTIFIHCKLQHTDEKWHK